LDLERFVNNFLFFSHLLSDGAGTSGALETRDGSHDTVLALRSTHRGTGMPLAGALQSLRNLSRACKKQLDWCVLTTLMNGIGGPNGAPNNHQQMKDL
jgi:hypothetical protein